MNRRIRALLLAGLLTLPGTVCAEETPSEAALEIPMDSQSTSSAELTEPPAECTSEPTEEATSEPTQEPSEEPTQEPAEDPTQGPTEEPTLESTEEPALESTEIPALESTEEPTPNEAKTQAPISEPSDEPSAAPVETSGAAPTVESTVESTIEPTIGPTVESTVEPSATPANPTELQIFANNAIQGTDSTWQFSLTDDLYFYWTAIAGAVYSWQVSDSNGNSMESGVQTENALSLNAQSYAPGLYVLSLRATVGEVTLEAQFSFVLGQAEQAANSQGEVSEEQSFQDAQAVSGMPTGGGRPAGGGRPSGSMSGASTEEQRFQITPGVALTSSHASGTKEMRTYGALALSLPEDAVRRLYLDGTALDVSLADGSDFTEALEGNVLILSPKGSAMEWTVNARTLKILRLSGIDALELHFDGGSTTLFTDLEFCGTVYARYRSQGHVSKDFELHVCADGTTITIAGERWLLGKDGSLVAK